MRTGTKKHELTISQRALFPSKPKADCRVLSSSGLTIAKSKLRPLEHDEQRSGSVLPDVSGEDVRHWQRTTVAIKCGLEDEKENEAQFENPRAWHGPVFPEAAESSPNHVRPE